MKFNANIKTKRRFNFDPIEIRSVGKKRNDFRLIKFNDAIKTTWMILEGMGYMRSENPLLERLVREVFDTAPAIYEKAEREDG